MTDYRKSIVAGLFVFGVVGAADAGKADWTPDANSWMQTGKVGANPVVSKKHDEFAFSPTGRIEVREIGGDVEVTAGKSDKVEFDYERKASTQQDLDCQEFQVQHDKDTLRIRVEWHHVPACHVIHSAEKLTLKVPRGAEVSLHEIGDKLRVTGLEGRLRISDVGDSATLKDIQQLEAGSVGDDLRLEVSRLGPAGIKIQSVGDNVELTLPDKLDAHMRIDSVGDEIRAPGVHLTSLHDRAFDAVLGKGGPLIYIESVGDSVWIKSGPEMKITPEKD